MENWQAFRNNKPPSDIGLIQVRAINDNHMGSVGMYDSLDEVVYFGDGDLLEIEEYPDFEWVPFDTNKWIDSKNAFIASQQIATYCTDEYINELYGFLVEIIINKGD